MKRVLSATLGVAGMLLSLCSMAAPVGLIEFGEKADDSESIGMEFVEEFIAPGDYPAGFYEVAVITEIVSPAPPSPKVKEKYIPLGEVSRITLTDKGSHMHKELDWMWGEGREVFRVTAKDGSEYETLHRGEIFYRVSYGRIAGGLAYKTSDGSTRKRSELEIRRILLGTPDEMHAAWEAFEKKRLAQLKSKEERERHERQRERERKQKEVAKVRSFQKSIKIGDETNCGPVLDVRADLLKVYVPVQGYGNEHWMRRDTLFPSGYGCQFFNGRYEPPPSR